TVKNYQWMDFTSGLFQAHDGGYDSVVLCDSEGLVTEGPGFNVFAVHEGKVKTSGHGVLRGITRRTVLESCRALGIPVIEGPLYRGELEGADEVFITSTAGGVVGIRQ